MTADSYREYLKSEQWGKLRLLALERSGYRCQVCNSPDGLEVHHRTYERVTQEDLSDLVALCDRCHAVFHENSIGGSRTLPISKVLGQYFEILDQKLSKEDSRTTSINTGFIDLDSYLVDLQPGDLIVVSGSTGVGKSAFLFNLARNITVDQNRPSAFLCMEHNRTQVVEHLISGIARIDNRLLRNGHLTSKDMEIFIHANEQLRGVSLQIDDSERQSMNRIAASARQLKQEFGLQVLFIDCIDLIDPENMRDFRNEQLAGISRRLKKLAKELGIIIIATSRLGKIGDDRSSNVPWLSDLRSVEQEADAVLILHRPGRYDKSIEDGMIELHIAKQRNGAVGEIHLAFIPKMMRFENIAYEQ